MVVRRADGGIVHARFRDLPEFLEPGDLLVVNTSATLPAAVPPSGADGEQVGLHFATPAPGAADGARCLTSSSCEPRRGAPRRIRRQGERSSFREARRATICRALRWRRAPLGRRVRAGGPVPRSTCSATGDRSATRTCPASARSPTTRPPSRSEPGSAEMPSAGRPFTPELVTALIAAGSSSRRSPCTPASPRPSPTSLRTRSAIGCPASTAGLVNATRDWRRPGDRGRNHGRPRPGDASAGADGSSRRQRLDQHVVTPQRGVRRGRRPAHRLARARGLAPAHARGDRAARTCVARAYAAAAEHGYLWHEFGDLKLILGVQSSDR